MDLIPSNTNLILSENDKIIQSFNSKKIKDCAERDIDIELSNAVDKAILFLGLNINKEDRFAVKMMSSEDIRNKFPLLGIKEISIAIESGVRGKYGEVFGVAPKDIYNWISSYSLSVARIENHEKWVNENNKPIEISDEQKADVYWIVLIKAFESFKQNNGFYNDLGNAVYNLLDANNKINFSKEQKLEFKAQAISNLKSQYNPIKHVGNIIKMNESKAILTEILSDDKNSRIISEAKKIALNKFFADLFEMDIEIEDLFNEV